MNGPREEAAQVSYWKECSAGVNGAVNGRNVSWE